MCTNMMVSIFYLMNCNGKSDHIDPYSLALTDWLSLFDYSMVRVCLYRCILV